MDKVESCRKYDDRVKSLMDSYFDRHNDIPDTLYHYTSANALLGIARSNSLFLTNARFLNDPGELLYAAKMVKESVDEARDTYGAILDDFQKHIEEILDPSKLNLEVYVTCFCENGDLLSQWRSYSGNADGYSVGFDFTEINQTAVQNGNALPSLRKVSYSQEGQKALISNLTNSIAELIVESDDDIDFDRLQKYRQTVAECMITFKSRKYREEREWRLISVIKQPKELQFLAKSGVFKPYVEYKPQELLPIRKVVAGPVLDFRTTKPSVTMMLQHHSFPQTVKVKRSRIAYRAL